MTRGVTRAALLIAALLLAIAGMTLPASADPGDQTVFGDAVPAKPTNVDTQSIELAMRFTVNTPGVVRGVRFFKGQGNGGTHTGYLYEGNSRKVSVTFTNETPGGWQTAIFQTPFTVAPGKQYSVSYFAPQGRYAEDLPFAWPKTSGAITASGSAYRYGRTGGSFPNLVDASNYYVDVVFAPAATPPTTTTPAPTTTTAPPPPTTTVPPTTTTEPPPTTTTTPPPSTGYPDAGNTGPAAAPTQNYTGPCSIRTNTTIENKVVNCALQVYDNASLTIRGSIVNGFIENTAGTGKVDIADSEVRGGDWRGGVLWGSHFLATRVEVTGGQHSVHCDTDCTIVDSWLHGQVSGNWATHNNAFLSNGGSGYLVRHNTLHCSAPANSQDGGCTADLSMFGDFAGIRDATIENNLFVATASGGYCGTFGHNPGKPYGANPTNVKVTGNVFQRGPNGKCGVFGAATSFLAANGNEWAGNVWDDGAVLNP